MNRILKVFATEAEQERLAETLDVIERYDAFVVAEAAPATARKVARELLVEDITDQYQTRSARERSTRRSRASMPRA